MSVTRSLEGKFSAGDGDIPEYLVIQCTQHIKKPLPHIYHAFKLGIFSDRLKTAKVKHDI